jgi:hypothetical protein
MNTRPHNLEFIRRDRGYRFGDRDPDMEWICSIIYRSELSIGDIIEKVLDVSQDQVHISYGTISKWLDGTTKRPQNHTLKWVALALGYERSWTPTTKS